MINDVIPCITIHDTSNHNAIFFSILLNERGYFNIDRDKRNEKETFTQMLLNLCKPTHEKIYFFYERLN